MKKFKDYLLLFTLGPIALFIVAYISAFILDTNTPGLATIGYFGLILWVPLSTIVWTLYSLYYPFSHIGEKRHIRKPKPKEFIVIVPLLVLWFIFSLAITYVAYAFSGIVLWASGNSFFVDANQGEWGSLNASGAITVLVSATLVFVWVFSAGYWKIVSVNWQPPIEHSKQASTQTFKNLKKQSKEAVTPRNVLVSIVLLLALAGLLASFRYHQELQLRVEQRRNARLEQFENYFRSSVTQLFATEKISLRESPQQCSYSPVSGSGSVDYPCGDLYGTADVQSSDAKSLALRIAALAKTSMQKAGFSIILDPVNSSIRIYSPNGNVEVDDTYDLYDGTMQCDMKIGTPDLAGSFNKSPPITERLDFTFGCSQATP